MIIFIFSSFLSSFFIQLIISFRLLCYVKYNYYLKIDYLFFIPSEIFKIYWIDLYLIFIKKFEKKIFERKVKIDKKCIGISISYDI